ncbi:hypothetical protein B7C42_01681 [Nocardia cerradoensis]|uniref:Uncharacterized protein n=1 Tax=Nocardia cerradoensis TaxID=85688 RepID=A0A231HD56_9NOCA|nr:hypothetical protein [Nocardia cerradoensis]OXR46705.1 hypothetical protein B7C42_01681 [Nocardia cerradoensis]
MSVEQERREALLSQLPGKEHYDRFDGLNRASQVFSGNGQELSGLLRHFIGTDLHVERLPDGYDVEVMRRFHNYVASVATLRDVQRATHRKLWPDRVSPDDSQNQKTVWEVEIYSPKAEEVFGSDSIKFLFDLRNFTVHYSIPPLTLGTTIRWEGGGPVVQENKVELKRAELLKYRKWGSAAKRYLKSHEGDIDFLSILEEYSTAAREFYEWFWCQVESKVRGDVDEFLAKSNELGLWLTEHNARPDWSVEGEPVRGSLRRNRARTRAARAEHGTRGWNRYLMIDEHGVASVAPSGDTWDPFPATKR